jgi:hypothetical protein
MPKNLSHMVNPVLYRVRVFHPIAFSATGHAILDRIWAVAVKTINANTIDRFSAPMAWLLPVERKLFPGQVPLNPPCSGLPSSFEKAWAFAFQILAIAIFAPAGAGSLFPVLLFFRSPLPAFDTIEFAGLNLFRILLYR